MLAAIKGFILGPIWKMVLKRALTGIDAQIDTAQEREAIAEQLLEKYRPAIKKSLIHLIERGHIELDRRGY